MRCSCKRGVMRDNCPECEGTGERIDFRALRVRHPAPGTVGEEDYPPEWGIWRRNVYQEGGEA